MGQQKGGKKLRRCAKHKGLYAAQVFRTAKNKASARTRIARRKEQKPNPNKPHYRRKARRNNWARREQERHQAALTGPVFEGDTANKTGG
jgi:hypothetical protein